MLKAVTGVSIGAINAACIVGAKDRADARRRLRALWDDLTLETPAVLVAAARAAISRCSGCRASMRRAATSGMR